MIAQGDEILHGEFAESSEDEEDGDSDDEDDEDEPDEQGDIHDEEGGQDDERDADGAVQSRSRRTTLRRRIADFKPASPPSLRAGASSGTRSQPNRNQ